MEKGVITNDNTPQKRNEKTHQKWQTSKANSGIQNAFFTVANELYHT